MFPDTKHYTGRGLLLDYLRRLFSRNGLWWLKPYSPWSTTPEKLVGRGRVYKSKYLGKKEIADLLRKHGGKTGEELKAEGK